MQQFLIQRIRELSAPLEPLSTGVEPAFRSSDGLKAVVFDVYGTLFISGVGDISLSQVDARESGVRDALDACGLKIRPEWHDAMFGQQYFNRIREHQARRRDEGIEHPEVDLRAVWSELAGEWRRADVIEGPETDPERLAIEYECRVNPCWPMPRLNEVLESLRDAGLAMSIVSNAQFFTPLLFDALAGETLDALGIDPECNVWSYELLEGKPSTHLYECAADALCERYGIAPEQALFVGNDRRNDVWPAQACGFQTALFAGDARSLRLREDDERLEGVSADFVIDSLDQVLSIAGL